MALPYASTTSFSQEAVGDELSDTDWALTKFDITVQCLINAAYLSQLAPALIQNGVSATSNPADIMNAIRTVLLRRRRALSFKFNGVEMIPQPQGGQAGTVDAKNGPIPKSCTYIALTNTLFILKFHIVAHYWENNLTDPTVSPITQNQQGANVLWNRWSETVEIDKQQYTTRTREGKYVIRSDNVDGFYADQARYGMAVVGVPPGCLRESSYYKVDPSGLGIEYRVRDQEVFKLPPSPAYHAEGEYTESVPKAGAIRYGDCRVALKGAKSTPQDALIRTAIAVVLGKLAARRNALNPGNGWQVIESAHLKIGMYSNDVEFQARFMLAVDFGRIGTSTLTTGTGIPQEGGKPASTGKPTNFLDAFNGVDTVTPLSTQPTKAPPYLERATAGFVLRAAAYYDPSLRGVTVQNDQLSAGAVVGSAGQTAEP